MVKKSAQYANSYAWHLNDLLVSDLSVIDVNYCLYPSMLMDTIINVFNVKSKILNIDTHPQLLKAFKCKVIHKSVFTKSDEQFQLISMFQNQNTVPK